MRPENLYLNDIKVACSSIVQFIQGVEFDEFLENELLQSAVLQKLIVIGEASARISKEFRETHSEILWPDIIGFRNIAVHEYFAIMWKVVWETVKFDIPELFIQINKILEIENSD